MTRFIVDASVSVPWVIPEIWSSHAGLLLDAQYERVAPAWIALENANAVWKRVQRGELTMEQAHQILAVLPLYLTYVDVAALIEPAFDIALTINQTVYDSVYVALAERTGLKFVTGDRPLYDAVKRTMTTSIVWIEDLPAELA